MRYADIGGHRIAYRRGGEGPAVVLLHGFTHDSRAWRPQLESLSDAFDVTAWEAPGAGGSADPTEPFVIDQWADVLAGFMDSIDVPQAHVAGLSWGGLLAQELYRRHGHRVNSLVLADTDAGWKGSLPDPMPQERLAACLRDASLPAAEFVERYLPSMFGPAACDEVRMELGPIMTGFHQTGFRLMATAVAEADTRDLLSLIRVPTLLIWGEQDARSPLLVAEQFRNAIPGATLVVIPDVGHVSNLEAPQRFNDEVRAFWSALG